jgi:glycosyltransferase involved in cell wall biosynthesis
MANALAQQGDTVHILAKSSTVPDLLHSGVRFHMFAHTTANRPFPWLDKFLRNEAAWEQGYSLSARNLILKLHAEQPVDCVEIPEYNGLAYEFVQPLPFPVVVHFHTPTWLIDRYNQQRIGGRQRRWYAFESKAITGATAFRSPSNALKTEMSRKYEIDENRITVIPHPVDTSAYDAIMHVDTGRDTIDILFSGRLERRKGGDILLRDVHRLLELDPRVRITFAGELDMGDAGNYRNAIERSLSEAQRHRIWLLGPTKRQDLAVLYRRSTMLLLPSLFENAPYALLEAMAAKLPVVAARTSGIAELIRHNETGLLFDIDTPDSLLDCVKAFIESPQHAAECAQRAYNFVVDNCAPAEVARRSKEYYASVADSFKSDVPSKSSTVH